MSKSPYYQIKIKDTGEDITKYVTDFVHEDCLEEDDLLKFSLNDINQDFIENSSIEKGTTILFQYGYLGYKITNAAFAVVKRIEPKFGDIIRLSITCLDKGSNMKRNASSKIWKNQTASQIIKTIVERYSLELVSEPTKKVYSSIPQGNRTDFEFIRYLTGIEQSGSYIFYIKEFKAYFVKRDLKKEPAITFTYRDGTGKVIAFSPVESDEGDKNAKTEASVSSVNPVTGETINATASPDKLAEGEGFMGNAAGELLEIKNTDTSNTTGQNIPFPARTQEDAVNVVNAENKKASLKSMTASLVIEGDTLIKSGDLISIAGVPSRYAGVWRVIKVTHTINGGGYISTLELDRNIPTAKTKASDINKKVGPKQGEETKKVYNYDKNGNRIDGGASGDY